MKYTKEQLQGMSDFDVNKLLANILGIFWHSRPANNGTRQWHYSPNYEKCNFTAIELPDYCNNWNDVMPLAVEHLSRIEKVWGKWTSESNAFDNIYCYRFEDKDPLRSIACCLILVLQEKRK